MQYNVWLGNPRGMTFDWNELCREVARLFAPVVKEHKDFTSVYVRSTMKKPSLASHELLVYVVPTRLHGVIGARFKQPEQVPSQYGDTRWEGTLTGAEVYRRGLLPKQLAKFVFHEALHAKTHKATNQVGTKGLGTCNMNYMDATLHPDNVALMVKNLKNLHAPWTGAFDLIQP